MQRAAPLPGSSTRHLSPPGRQVLLPVVVCAVLCAGYLIWTPPAPDLAAQVARTRFVHLNGGSSWWTGWFGGIVTIDYSVMVPQVMAAIGVRTTGALAAIVASAAIAVLTRDAPRPRLAALAGTVMVVANLLDGRVTFGVGVALGAWALVALGANRSSVAVALAVATYLASPLAGLFVGMIMVAVVLGVARLRKAAIAVAVALAVLSGAMFVYFPTTGSMPFHVVNALPPALCCVAVLVTSSTSTIRWLAVIVLAAMVFFLLVTTPVGTNVCRLVWVGALPVIAGYGRLPGLPGWTQPLVFVAAAVVAIYPAADLSGQIRYATSASAHADFYQPLRTELANALRAQPTTLGQRVEIVAPATHWESAFVPGVALARGWDRQADHTDNPIFYVEAPLTASSYHTWLHELAVGWVALPATRLDYASRAEGALVAAGLPYLQAVWHSADWQLFRVTDPTALVQGARLDSVTDTAVTITTSEAGVVRTRIRWSPYVTTSNPGTRRSTPTCLMRVDGWVDVYVPRAESVTIGARFTLSGPVRSAPSSCRTELSDR